MEKLDIEKEEPKEVLKFFKEISDIPRESGNEEQIKNYLVKFAMERNLEYYTDEYFNVVIRKKNVENKDFIAFQAHTDMICEKESWSKQDFTKDPIELMKDGEFIKAKGTSLGADNGIGVAFMLAMLDSKKIESFNLECIFTVQEETTMIGAKKIDVNQIKAKKIISLDNGKEGKMVISSANCMEWYGKVKKEYIVNKNMGTYKLTYSNFKGGHSGENIADKNRGNPIKLGIEVISKIEDIYINQISGGSRVNVIPRDFNVIFSCKENIEEYIKKEIEKQKHFYGDEVKIKLEQIEAEERMYSKETTNQIIKFINSYNNGAIKFDESKNVILSANFGALNEFEDYIQLEYSLRSNDMKLRNEYLKKLRKLVNENNIEIIWKQELKGFEPDYTSELVVKTSEVYKKIFNEEIEKIIVQGVVEGGFFKDRIKDVQYICIGADTYDIHSPKERVSITSIKRTWRYLKEILKVF